MTVKMWILAYVLVTNLIGFILMGIDKSRARNHAWRIPEAVLFTVALVGGSIGSILGMYTFRHKTKHKSFVFGMPAILLIQLALVIWLVITPSISITFM